MSDSTTRYVPRDYRRVCDVCGNLRNISQMHKQDELWVCTYDYGERVRTELDRGNARQRPFTIKPVPHAKPWDNYYPNSLETDEAATFNFLAQQVAAQCRYELVESGGAVYMSQGGGLPALSWAARYYYDLIISGERELLQTKARELLNAIAVYLTTRQKGFGLSSDGQASDPWWGGFLASGATSYITQDAATSGLALLYAYRVLGTTSYLAGARAAASYLRNVQAIGRYGTNYTSSNAAGTARLYTGAVASKVSTTTGVDPGTLFYADHLFYPGDLIALEFWNELKITDGDQNIGATGTASDAFISAPSQLLSVSITDMRTCWETGISGTVGLSTSTPKEFFNAYPQSKTGFPTIVGTGEWEYANGNADEGTQISSQNWAMAVSSLYNYEGATATVTGISDWLRTFTSNADFETPDDTSTSVLYRTTTGTYDPTVTIATRLQVRDPDTFAATKINGSSLYDWGAFGLLSRLWASRNTASFRQSRLYPLNTVQRYYDGNSTDVQTDRITLRGMSGLSMQTGFRNVQTTFGDFDSISSEPEQDGIGFWFQSDQGATVNGSGQVSALSDLTGNGWDLTTPSASEPVALTLPAYVPNQLNGNPAIRFALNTDALAHYGPAYWTGPMLGPFTADMPFGPFLEDEPQIVMAVVKPSEIAGGMIFAHRLYFSFEVWIWSAEPTVQRLARSLANLLYVTPVINYTNTVILVTWRWTGTEMFIYVNNLQRGPTIQYFGGQVSATFGGVADASSERRMYMGQSGSDNVGYRGDVFAIIGYKSTTVPEKTVSYLAGLYGSAVSAMTNDAVRAAQFGRSYREARN